LPVLDIYAKRQANESSQKKTKLQDCDRAFRGRAVFATEGRLVDLTDSLVKHKSGDEVAAPRTHSALRHHHLIVETQEQF
jgi:hypothetical protein